MGNISSLSKVTPNVDVFCKALDAVKIDVSCGRHFTLIVGKDTITTTMKDIVSHFNEHYKAHTDLRDKIIFLDLQADAKLRNSQVFGAQFIAWVLRILGRTWGHNYHINQLMQEEKPNPTGMSVVEAMNDLSEEELKNFAQARINQLVGMGKEADLALSEIEQKFSPRKVGNMEEEKDKLQKPELIDLFLKTAEANPFRAFYAIQSPLLSGAEQIVLCTRIEPLNQMVIKAFQKAVAAVD